LHERFVGPLPIDLKFDERWTEDFLCATLDRADTEKNSALLDCTSIAS
jgi:hypothetical protein